MNGVLKVTNDQQVKVWVSGFKVRDKCEHVLFEFLWGGLVVRVCVFRGDVCLVPTLKGVKTNDSGGGVVVALENEDV